MDNNDFDLNKIINMPEDATIDWARFFWGTKWNTQNTKWFDQSKNPTFREKKINNGTITSP